jgi:CheY-like chemotaxis protein
MIRLVVADDHPVVCTGLLGILAADPELSVVGVAADGTAALEHVERARPDVAMLDLRMPGLDGIEVTRGIVARGLATRVLVLTTYVSMADVAAARARVRAEGRTSCGALRRHPRRCGRSTSRSAGGSGRRRRREAKCDESAQCPRNPGPVPGGSR